MEITWALEPVALDSISFTDPSDAEGKSLGPALTGVSLFLTE